MLSENGVKILFDKLKEYYEGLNQTKKNYFNQELNAPCPTNIAKSNPIYFWKFIDQFLCYRSGPRAIKLRAAKSAKLLSAINLANRKSINAHGALPQEQIDKILNHLGFSGEYTHASRNIFTRNPKFIIVSEKHRNGSAKTMARLPNANSNFELMYAIISVTNFTNETNLPPSHSITGFICNNEKYIFDPNLENIFKINWTKPKTLQKFVNAQIAPRYRQLKNVEVLDVSFDLAVYARKQYVKNIAPSCMLRVNRNNMSMIPPVYRYSLENRYLGPKLNAGNYNMLIPPRWRIALKKAWLASNFRKNKYINKAIYNSVLNKANSKVNAYSMLFKYRQNGYKENMTSQNFKNFNRALNKKFP